MMGGSLGYLNFPYLKLAMIICLTAGCSTTTVPVGKYDVLAESSQNILKGTTETYTRIEQLQRRFIVETVSDSPLTRDTFRPVIDGQSFDLTPELRFCEAALEVLVRYALVLQAFAKRDFAGEVDKATEELAGSLKVLAATAAPDNESAAKASGILATVVNIIGRAIVQGKRLNQSTQDWYGEIRQSTGRTGISGNHVYQSRVVRFRGTEDGHGRSTV